MRKDLAYHIQPELITSSAETNWGVTTHKNGEESVPRGITSLAGLFVTLLENPLISRIAVPLSILSIICWQVNGFFVVH